MENCNIESKMMKLNKKEMHEIIRKIKEKYLKIELDGKNIKQWNDYIKAVGDMLEFPEDDKYPNRDGYLDWMRDLGWIPFNQVLLIINNYEYFMKDNVKDRKDFCEMMAFILKFWNKKRNEKNSYYKKKMLVFLVT